MYKPEGLSRSSKSLETCAGSGEMRAKCVPLWMYYRLQEPRSGGGGVKKGPVFQGRLLTNYRIGKPHSIRVQASMLSMFLVADFFCKIVYRNYLYAVWRPTSNWARQHVYI